MGFEEYELGCSLENGVYVKLIVFEKRFYDINQGLEVNISIK